MSASEASEAQVMTIAEAGMLPVQATAEGASVQALRGVPLQPLWVSGLVVRKADLIDALRVYVPALRDVQLTEDGEHYWLLLSDAVQDGTDEGGDHADTTAG
jgi:hypothetical protein